MHNQSSTCSCYKCIKKVFVFHSLGGLCPSYKIFNPVQTARLERIQLYIALITDHGTLQLLDYGELTLRYLLISISATSLDFGGSSFTAENLRLSLL